MCYNIYRVCLCQVCLTYRLIFNPLATLLSTDRLIAFALFDRWSIHISLSRSIGYHPHISRSIGTIHTSLDRSGTIHTSLDRSHTIHHLSIDRVPSTLLSIDRVPSTHLSIDRIPSTHRRTSTSFQKKPIRVPIREPSSCRIRMKNNYVASPRVTMAISGTHYI